MRGHRSIGVQINVLKLNPNCPYQLKQNFQKNVLLCDEHITPVNNLPSILR
jgi:hypothetical protein